MSFLQKHQRHQKEGKIKIWKATPRKLNLKDTCEVCGVIAGIKSQIEHLIAERSRRIQRDSDRWLWMSMMHPIKSARD